MKHILLLTPLLLVMNAAFGQEEPITTSAPSKVEMLIPGVIQPGQPKIQSGETWWGLCETKEGGYELVQTIVIVSPGKGTCCEEGVPNIKTDLDKDFLFLLRGSPFFEEGRVKTESACKYKQLPPEDEVQVRDFGKGCYSIFARGDTDENDLVLNYSISIRERGKQRASTQKILRLERTCMKCEETPTILWVGDIDRDNRPDIFLDARPYPGSRLMLFLSSEAQDGEIVHKIAELKMLGC
jgi:hypothetical protein